MGEITYTGDARFSQCIKNLGRPHHKTSLGSAYLGDSLNLLKKLPSASIDLVITSPPFALITEKEYGNPSAKEYCTWFDPFAKEICRVLKSRGSFVIEIGGSWTAGKPIRTAYNFKLLLSLMQNFKLAQEIYWYNPAKLPSPAQWVTIERIRLKDSVSSIWWFSRSSYPRASNRKVLVEYSRSMQNLFKNGYQGGRRPSGHNIGINTFMKEQNGAIPSNLIVASNTSSTDSYLRACKNRNIKPHPARFPRAIPELFIKMTTRKNDLILDPFAGSNVTGVVAEGLGRHWLAFEIRRDYLDGARLRFIGL